MHASITTWIASRVDMWQQHVGDGIHPSAHWSDCTPIETALFSTIGVTKGLPPINLLLHPVSASLAAVQMLDRVLARAGHDVGLLELPVKRMVNRWAGTGVSCWEEGLAG